MLDPEKSKLPAETTWKTTVQMISLLPAVVESAVYATVARCSHRLLNEWVLR